MKTAAECEPIHRILIDHTDPVEDGYFISIADYTSMLDALQEREQAFRAELQEDISKLRLALELANKKG